MGARRAAETVRRLSPDYSGAVLSTTRLSAPVPRRTTLPRAMDSFDPWTITAGAGAAWVTDGSARLTRIDERTGAVRFAQAGMPLDGVATSGGQVWAISGPRGDGAANRPAERPADHADRDRQSARARLAVPGCSRRRRGIRYRP
jgi:hypothetical protein